MQDGEVRASPGQLTVGEVAQLAGVSPRTVRHYHTIGVLPEPPRDSAGYRRYGSKDVIALVRVVRLRALGMSLPKIAERVVHLGGDDSSLPTDLRALADEMDDEINQLVAARDRLRELAESKTFDKPVQTLTDALRGHGVLGPYDELRTGEGWAAALLDALHPQGMPGVLDQASDLLTDPVTLNRLSVLLERFRALGKNARDDEIDALADEVAAVLPWPAGGALVDIELMDKLVTDRLNRPQQRFMHRLRDKAVTP